MNRYKASWQSLDSRPMPTWFKGAKFGIFIHWGLYSVPAYRPLREIRYGSYAEWYYSAVINDQEHGGAIFHKQNYGEDFEYRDFAPMFKAELFDADAWASLFQRAGAKYVVLTTKHHDGYCLWPTNVESKRNWNSKDVGPERDLMGELTEAVRRHGLRMGVYHSTVEWETNRTHKQESGYFIDKKSVDKYGMPESEYIEKNLIPLMKELVDNYKPSLIFADGGEWDFTEEYFDIKKFLAWLYNESSVKDEIVVNDRFVKDMPGKHGDYYSSEYQDSEAIGADHPWEENRGIGGSYGFNRAEQLDDYRTAGELVQELISIVGRGGNLLLNVGPRADGVIPVFQQHILTEIGKWLEVNGEGIYDTEFFRKQSKDGLFFTKKGADFYIMSATWPGDQLIIEDVNSQVRDVIMLGTAKKVQWNVVDKVLTFTSPAVTPGEIQAPYGFLFKVINGVQNFL